jgi:hypothetical protein
MNAPVFEGTLSPDPRLMSTDELRDFERYVIEYKKWCLKTYDRYILFTNMSNKSSPYLKELHERQNSTK